MIPSGRQYTIKPTTPSSSSSSVPHDLYRFGSSSSSSTSHQHSGTASSRSEYWTTVLDASPHPPRHSDVQHPTLSRQTQRACPSCRRTFTSTHSFEEHVRSCPPNTEKPFACETCGTAFKKHSNLVKHMKLVHLGERNFACQEPGCGRLFGQKSNLNSHIKAVHLGEKPYVCTEVGCGRRFSQKSGLKAHIKTVHHGERPYVCKECNSSFGHRGDLNRHIRVLHEQQRPFLCTVCPEPRAFGRKSVLARHMQTHGAS